MRASALLALFVLCVPLEAVRGNDLRGQPRQIHTLEMLTLRPLFVMDANTLDPLDIVRKGRAGYLAKCWEPWGMTMGLEPTYRFYFDNRLLPWPELKHHGVDGFDNNSRNLGAHALLHDMLGDEKKNDPIERGQIAYLLSITDPEGGLPYSADGLPRHCALGHGELCKNVILLYEQTGEPWLKDWAAKMLSTLRRYAHVRHLEGVGPVAEYYQGGKGGQGGFNVGEDPVAERPGDLALDGWQHLYNGWNCWAFAKWHQLTGDKAALDFAVALANRLMNSGDEYGNDGSFRPDGSFGSSQGVAGSIHGHSHAHCLPGLVLLGDQLIRTGRRDEGLGYIRQAEKSFRFLFDRSTNPDAGSYTGWVPEFLSATGGDAWKDRYGDCEGCTTGDVVQVATMLGAASRLDSELAHLEAFYDWAERFYRGITVNSFFEINRAYRQVLRAQLEKRVRQEAEQTGEELSPAALHTRVELLFEESLETAQRMEGRVVGLCSLNDWVNHLPSDEGDYLNCNMMGCCADASIRASHAIWSQSVTTDSQSGDAQEVRINLAVNRQHPQVDVVSCLPHRGEVNVSVKDAQRVLIRLPSWTEQDAARAFVDRGQIPLKLDGNYVVFDDVEHGQQLTLTYPLRIAQVTEVIRGKDFVEYTERWRGNTIVDISPGGQWIPMFEHPELDTEQLP